MSTDKIKPKTAPTAAQRMADEVSALLRARAPVIWVQTAEELRAENVLVEAAAANRCNVYKWDCVTGLTDMTDKEVDGSKPDGTTVPGKQVTDPVAVLGSLKNDKGEKARAVWILRDFPIYLKDPRVLRMVRTLARMLPRDPVVKAIVILSPLADVPSELSDVAIVVRLDLPDRIEIAQLFDTVVKYQNPPASLKEADAKVYASKLASYEATKASPRDACVEAAVGLSSAAAAICYTKSIVTNRGAIVPSVVAAEKKRIVARESGLEWIDPDPRGMGAVGGLEHFKAWLLSRKAARSERARAYGLPMPKGCLVVGMSGTGKSLTAKALAAEWSVPLIRMDLGAMKGSLVGQSERQLRNALAIVDATGECVLLLDEVEKMLAGASGSLDSGVSADQMGALLTWMQERKGPAFVVATANNVRALPPEFMRKERFDDVWAVDLPTLREREEILKVALTKYGRDGASIDRVKVATACHGFTGAEVVGIVPEAMFVAFAESEREITTEDLLTAAKHVVPLARTSSEQVNTLREWIRGGRARAASASDDQHDAPAEVGAAVADVSAFGDVVGFEPGKN